MAEHVSIVVPMHNAAATIGPCLEGIRAQVPEVAEVILVDDGCTDDTVAMARPYPFRVVPIQGARKASMARNCGARNASGDIIVFIDADIVIPPGAVAAIVAALSAGPGAQAACGLYADETRNLSFYGQLQNLLMIYRHRNPPAAINFMFSSFCAVRRSVFEAIGGFNEDMAAYEDVEFGARLTGRGYRCILEPTLQVTHLKDYTHAGLVTDYFRKACAAGRFCSRRTSSNVLRVQNAPLAFKLASVWALAIAAAIVGLPLAPAVLPVALAGYTVFLFPALAFLAERRGLRFALAAYLVCFEIFITSHAALAYGLVSGRISQWICSETSTGC